MASQPELTTDQRVRKSMRTLLEGLQPSYVAEELGVSRQAVNRWYRGYNVTADRLEQVARLRLGPFLWEDPDGPMVGAGHLKEIAGMEAAMLRQMLEGLDAKGQLHPPLGTGELLEQLQQVQQRLDMLVIDRNGEPLAVVEAKGLNPKAIAQVQASVDDLITRREVQELVRGVEERVTQEIIGNRDIAREITDALPALKGLSALLENYRQELERIVQQRGADPPQTPEPTAQETSAPR